MVEILECWFGAEEWRKSNQHVSKAFSHCTTVSQTHLSHLFYSLGSGKLEQRQVSNEWLEWLGAGLEVVKILMPRKHSVTAP